MNKKFIKYTGYSAFKLFGNIFLLWLFVDKLLLPLPNNIIRALVLCFWFIFSFIIYEKIFKAV